MTKKVRFVVLKSAPSDIVLIWGGRLADLRGTSFGLRELVQVGFLPRLPEPVPGPLRFAPSLRKQAALDGIFVAITFPSSSIRTVYIGLSTGVYISSTTTYVRKNGDLFLLVVQDPISRACHLSAPPILFNRMYSQLSLIPQRSRTY